MTPEYIEQLADIADPERLWQTPFFDLEKLTAEQRHRLDTGVALRRHADHIRRLQALFGTGQSLLITTLSESGHATATKTVPTPDSHRRLPPEAPGPQEPMVDLSDEKARIAALVVPIMTAASVYLFAAPDASRRAMDLSWQLDEAIRVLTEPQK